MKIGVLDIQGSAKEHFEALKNLAKNAGGAGAAGSVFDVVLIKSVAGLAEIKGLIIPGGESTTIGKLLKKFGLGDGIIKRAKKRMPVWGTCAGAILLAKKIVGEHGADTLGLMDISIERNGYGRQLDSFETQIEFDLGPVAAWFGNSIIPGVFIRAPKIMSVGKCVTVLARCGGEIIAARQKNLLITTFHPELTDDLKVHKYFVEMCEGKV
jgi:5'-phosphate synthase pdxT subunit